MKRRFMSGSRIGSAATCDSLKELIVNLPKRYGMITSSGRFSPQISQITQIAIRVMVRIYGCPLLREETYRCCL